MWRLTSFVAAVVAVLVAAWILRPNTVWDCQYLWLPVASLLGVVIRNTTPEPSPPAPRPPGTPPPRALYADHADPVELLTAADVEQALRRVRGMVAGEVVKFAVIVAAVLAAWAGVAAFGLDGAAADDLEVRTAPRVDAVVVSAQRTNPAAAWSPWEVELRLPDGREVRLRDATARWEPGSHLQVVVDPEGDAALSVGEHSAAVDRWLSIGLGAVAAALIGLVGAGVLSGSRLPPWRWRRMLALRTVQECTVRAVQHRSRPSAALWEVTAEAGGQSWNWRVHRPDWTVLSPGAVLPLAGDLRPGGSVVLLTAPRLLLPATPLRCLARVP